MWCINLRWIQSGLLLWLDSAVWKPPWPLLLKTPDILHPYLALPSSSHRDSSSSFNQTFQASVWMLRGTRVWNHRLSVVRKVMERLVCNSLRHLSENGNLLSPFQAGFRQKRSTEDQLLRLSQSIADGFQQNPMQKTVIDFSKVYDSVWWDALLLKMAKKGVPTQMVLCWLSNRINWVTYEGEQNKKKVFKQGVPQETVLFS